MVFSGNWAVKSLHSEAEGGVGTFSALLFFCFEENGVPLAPRVVEISGQCKPCVLGNSSLSPV